MGESWGRRGSREEENRTEAWAGFRYPHMVCHPEGSRALATRKFVGPALTSTGWEGMDPSEPGIQVSEQCGGTRRTW